LAKPARFSDEIFFQEGYAEAISPPRENLLSKPVIGAGGWDRNDPAAEPGASAIGKVLVSSIIALCSRSVPVPIAEGDSPGGNVARDYAPCTDQGIVADAHTRKDDSAAADPDIASDLDGTTELQTGGPPYRIARMIRGEDLHCRPDLHLVADADRDDVEDHAVEIEKDPGTETDVASISAQALMKRLKLGGAYGTRRLFRRRRTRMMKFATVRSCRFLSDTRGYALWPLDSNRLAC
jgi:hypothetical protein